ncbi:MAG: acyltransferase [Candidatus Symbiothrix sp.]|jgi:hypothetical protein|nr:acyltransferase [Candidatus Symbiothrix sp.]
MEELTGFDDIRPYYDEELIPVIARLLEDSEFQRVAGYLFPDRSWEEMKVFLQSFTNIKDFQHNLIVRLAGEIAAKSADSIDSKGFGDLPENKSFTYISNHRDIILDASILNVELIKVGLETTEIAIGDNLLLQKWIEDIVRLNKSFIVKRSVSLRQILEVSHHLSEYIHFVIQHKKESIWIAQREGRAKDSNDRTQESLLKMLAMGGNKNFLKSIASLNIVPVAFSYEYDPCDYLKAKEFQLKRDIPEFKKTQQDDVVNMQTGLFGYKGKVHVQIGQPINSILPEIDLTLGKNEQIKRVASLIDNEIFLNYRFYPVNYIAYDRLEGAAIFKAYYTPADTEIFDAYLQKQLDRIDLPSKDIPFLTERILTMYANPLRNNLLTKQLCIS